MRLSFCLASLVAACGARAHTVGDVGDADADADADADDGADADADADGSSDVDADADDAVCGDCSYVPSGGYHDLVGPDEPACAGTLGFLVRFLHGIGSHECATEADTHWTITQEQVGVAVYTVRLEAYLCYCEDECCPGGCGVEDRFETTIRIPTDRFGMGTYYVNAGDESITVIVDRPC